MAEAPKKNPLGPTGKAVADNIKRLRGDMQYVKLADRLKQLGRPIPTLGLRKIESYERRVDTDDLTALAAALGVSPITLLMPVANPDALASVSGQELETPAGYLWGWLRADNPLPSTDDFIPNYVDGVQQGGIPRFSAEFLSRSLPSWRFAEIEKEWARQQAQLDTTAAHRSGSDGDDQ